VVSAISENARIHLIVLIASRVVPSHPDNEIQDRHKGAYRIVVASKHHVTETDVVKRGYMTGSYMREG
jgi:hypothetical protein